MLYLKKIDKQTKYLLYFLKKITIMINVLIDILLMYKYLYATKFVLVLVPKKEHYFPIVYA